MHFFQSERSEPSYAQSRLWQKGDYRERLRLAAEQSFTTHIYQKFIWGGRLKQSFRNFPNARVTLVSFLDNYAAEVSLGGLIESQTESGLKNSLSAE